MDRINHQAFTVSRLPDEIGLNLMLKFQFTIKDNTVVMITVILNIYTFLTMKFNVRIFTIMFFISW